MDALFYITTHVIALLVGVVATVTHYEPLLKDAREKLDKIDQCVKEGVLVRRSYTGRTKNQIDV